MIFVKQVFLGSTIILMRFIFVLGIEFFAIPMDRFEYDYECAHIFCSGNVIMVTPAVRMAEVGFPNEAGTKAP